jgi:branched-chain amino acid aminotransferase
MLTLARDRQFKVSERVFNVTEMLDWVKTGEAALSGTAAVLAGVGTLIHKGIEHRVGSGDVGPQTRALRAQLVAIQQGEAPDPHGWLQRV